MNIWSYTSKHINHHIILYLSTSVFIKRKYAGLNPAYFLQAFFLGELVVAYLAISDILPLSPL